MPEKGFKSADLERQVKGFKKKCSMQRKDFILRQPGGGGVYLVELRGKLPYGSKVNLNQLSKKFLDKWSLILERIGCRQGVV